MLQNDMKALDDNLSLLDFIGNRKRGLKVSALAKIKKCEVARITSG